MPRAWLSQGLAHHPGTFKSLWDWTPLAQLLRVPLPPRPPVPVPLTLPAR